MTTIQTAKNETSRQLRRAWMGALVGLCLWQASSALALPIFARQTAHGCVACHAGGQFPELTPYGRMFKMTGYTFGERTIPIAAMGTVDITRTRNNIDSSGNPIVPKDGNVIFDAASVFLAGKITDHIGGFAQYTYVNYDHQDDQSRFVGRWGSDNTDIRYADRIITDGTDLVIGATLHNNPTVQDVFNTAPAWSYPYVSPPLSPVATPPATTLVEGGLAQQVVGMGAYAYWNKILYAEVSLYSTADGIWSFLSKGKAAGNVDHPQTYLRGSNPYWRVALTHEWGANNVMVGAFGLNADVYPNGPDAFPIFDQGVTRFRDLGFDAQYQYLLEPHTVSVQARYVRENIDDPNNLVFGDTTSANLNSLRLKASYIYNAKYGVSLSYFNISGTSDSVAYAGSATFSPATQGWMPEIFWMPWPYVRIGVQYTHFTKFFGATTNFDGNGRNARDNNTLFIYLWAVSW